ncbi:MAG: MFS transporter, partial [Trueperaceae bacterium]
TFGIPLIAIAVTGSAAQAGVISGVSLAARLIATLVGGVMADRRNRFALMVVGALVGVAVGLAFTLLCRSDGLSFTALLVLSVLLAVRRGVFDPGGEAAIKQVVPERALGRAMAANQARDAAVNLAGGPIGGALLGVGGWLVGVGIALGHGVAFLAASVLRRRVPVAAQLPTKSDADGQTLSLFADARSGVRWLFRRPDLRGTLLIGTVVNLGFNLGVTAIIYSLQLQGYSPLSIGWLTAIVSGTMFVAALVSPLVVTRVGAGALALYGLLLCTAGIVAVGFVQSFVATAALLAGSVVLVPALNAGLTGYMVLATPSALLGRVTSAGQVLGMGAMPLAPVLAGFGLALVGRPTTLLFAGALCFIAVVLVLLTPSIRALPKESEWRAHAANFGS